MPCTACAPGAACSDPCLPLQLVAPLQEAQESALVAQLRMPVVDVRAWLQRQAQAKERSEADVRGCLVAVLLANDSL